MYIPAQIFDLGRVNNSVYSMLVRGLVDGSVSQTLESLSHRTSLSLPAVRKAIRECVDRGFAVSKSGPHGKKRYMRSGVAPHVLVLDPISLPSNTVAHKLFTLVQMYGGDVFETGRVNSIGCGRSTLHAALRILKQSNLVSDSNGSVSIAYKTLCPVPRSLDVRTEFKEANVDLLSKSMSKARRIEDPKHGRSSILGSYSKWKQSGRCDLSQLSQSEASRIILAHYSFLAASIEDVFIPLNRQGVAAFSSVIDWLSAQCESTEEDFEAQRLARVSKGNPQETVLLAVMSTFSDVATYRKYGVPLVTTINESKNTFNSIALNTLIKANKKDPSWHFKLRNMGQRTVGSNSGDGGSKNGRRIRVRLQKEITNSDGSSRSGDTP